MIIMEGLRVLLFGMIGIFIVMGVIALMIKMLALFDRNNDRNN